MVTHINKPVINLTIIIIILLGCIVHPPAKDSSKAVQKTEKTTLTVSMFRITDQIPNWKEEKDTYKEFNTAGLYEIIDGGADFYIEFGLKKGVYQRLKETGNRQCDIFVEDYGSKENAKKIFNAKKEQISEPEKIDGFKDTMVVAEAVIGGVNVFVHKGNFYFEVLLTGFDSKERALEKAGSLIRYFIKIFDDQ